MPATLPADRGQNYDFITLALALGLIAAPWALGYSGDRVATGASGVAGAAIVACAIVAMTEFTRLFREVDLALGVLTGLAPWLLGFAGDRRALTAHLIVGAVVAAFSALELWWWRRAPRA
jgi:hypothetical protein